MHAVLLLILLSFTPPAAAAQALLNNFFTVAMQRCVAAVETGTAPRFRTLFSGTPTAGTLPEDMFAPSGYWLTADGRIFLTTDRLGNCAVGDTLAAEDAQAHLSAISKFTAWIEKETNAARYTDTGLQETQLDYRRTVVSTGWSKDPILVTLVSDRASGILALIAERSPIITDDGPSNENPPDDAASPGSPSSNLLNKMQPAPSSSLDAETNQ